MAMTLPAGEKRPPQAAHPLATFHESRTSMSSGRRKIAVVSGVLMLLVVGGLKVRRSDSPSSAADMRPDAGAEFSRAPLGVASELAPDVAKPAGNPVPLEIDVPMAIVPAKGAARSKSKPAVTASKSSPLPPSHPATTPNQDLDVGF